MCYAGPHTDAATHASFGPENRVTSVVHREGGAADRAGPGADPAFRPLEGDTALGQQLERAHMYSPPEIGRDRERVGGTGGRAGHIGADDARLVRRVDVRRRRGKPTIGRYLENRPDRTDRDTIPTPGACREEGDLGQRARRAIVLPGDHPPLSRCQQLLEPVADGMTKEITPGTVTLMNHTGRKLAPVGDI